MIKPSNTAASAFPVINLDQEQLSISFKIRLQFVHFNAFMENTN